MADIFEAIRKNSLRQVSFCTSHGETDVLKHTSA